MSLLRVAMVQVEPVTGDVPGNVATVAAQVERAAAQGARLVVLPEAVTTGYDPGAFAGALPPSADLSWLDRLQEAVERTGTTVVLNTPLDRGVHRTLTDLVLSPGTAPWVAYDKQHLYPPERPLFAAGGNGTSFELDGVAVALSVCYDAEFPEHAAAAAADGAHLYVNSGAYFPGGAHKRNLRHAARAVDNGLYVGFAGLVGSAAGFIGGTAVYDPTGRVVERLEEGTGMVVADVDTDAVDAARRDEQMLLDRRPDLGERRVRTLA